MTRKTAFFEGCSWFKFNNLRLALGTNLKFYTSLSKELKLKVRKFWGLIPTFVEITEEKLAGGGPFCLPPPPNLNRVKGLKIKKTSALFITKYDFSNFTNEKKCYTKIRRKEENKIIVDRVSMRTTVKCQQTTFIQKNNNFFLNVSFHTKGEAGVTFMFRNSVITIRLFLLFKLKPSIRKQ